ncbi:MAG: hypothetical protein JW791_04685 [Nanoarchaeota archaeon]|nr:hypothetical protein [Nanoarchaeota archaeon]
MNKFIHDNIVSHDVSEVVCLENARLRYNQEGCCDALKHVEEFYQKCNNKTRYARKVLQPVTKIIDCLNRNLEAIKKSPFSLFYSPY